MSWLQIVELFTVVGVVALVVLVWLFKRNRISDQLQSIIARRRASSKIVVEADFVEGMQHIPVALALTETTFHYENPDLQAEIELKRIDEVEYDTELATGKEVSEGKVLRLRSHGHAFEFILDAKSAAAWMSFLPPHRMDEPGTVHAV